MATVTWTGPHSSTPHTPLPGRKSARLSVGEEGTLSVKVKELIVLGILASRGLQYGVEAHMRRAIDYGATKDELFEAIKAAAIPGGGVAWFLQAERMPFTAFVQVPGAALKIEVSALAQVVDAVGSEFGSVLARYTQVWCTQLGQHAVCNRLHKVRARFARWILQTLDHVGRAEFPLTQELLAVMLGARRTSITAVARELQQQGLLRYRRGLVHVLDRAGLEAASCECYGVIRREMDRLLGPAHPAGLAEAATASIC